VSGEWLMLLLAFSWLLSLNGSMFIVCFCCYMEREFRDD
jgi:hypothetical protein